MKLEKEEICIHDNTLKQIQKTDTNPILVLVQVNRLMKEETIENNQ